MPTFLIYAISTRYGVECIDSADNAKEADYLTREYRMAYGPAWEVVAYDATKPAPTVASNARLAAALVYGE